MYTEQSAAAASVVPACSAILRHFSMLKVQALNHFIHFVRKLVHLPTKYLYNPACTDCLFRADTSYRLKQYNYIKHNFMF